MMLVVTLFATGVATFLFFFDQKAEATFYKENPDVKPEVKPPVTLELGVRLRSHLFRMRDSRF